MGGFNPTVVHFPEERLQSNDLFFSLPVGGFNLQSNDLFFSFLPRAASLPPVGGFNPSAVHFPGGRLQ